MAVHLELWNLVMFLLGRMQSRHLVKAEQTRLRQQWQEQKLQNTLLCLRPLFLLLIASKTIFPQSANHPRESWVLPSTPVITSEVRDKVEPPSFLVCWWSNWRTEMFPWWTSSAPALWCQDKLLPLLLNMDSNNRLSGCRSSWGLIIDVLTHWTLTLKT